MEFRREIIAMRMVHRILYAEWDAARLINIVNCIECSFNCWELDAFVGALSKQAFPPLHNICQCFRLTEYQSRPAWWSTERVSVRVITTGHSKPMIILLTSRVGRRTGWQCGAMKVYLLWNIQGWDGGRGMLVYVAAKSELFHLQLTVVVAICFS